MPDDMVMSMISVVVIIVYLCFFFQTILSNFSLSNLFDPMTLAENYETKSDNVGYNDGKVNIFGILKKYFLIVFCGYCLCTIGFRRRNC